MKFNAESKASVLAYINAANSTTFTDAQVEFGTPALTNGSWQGNTTTKNSVVRLTAKEGSGFEGTTIVAYDRLKLDDLANLQGVKIRANKPTSTIDLLAGFKYYAGMILTADDIEPTPLTDNGDGTYSGTLTAKSSSLGWIGSLPIVVTQGGLRMDELVVDTDLDGLNYPTASNTDVYGPLYTYPYDFTPYKATLDAIVDGATLTTEQADALVVALKAVDLGAGKATWNNDGAATTYSLNGAKCVTNGLNGSDLPTNPNYKYVMFLDLRAAVTAPKGTLILHYNDPIDYSSV